MRKFGRNAIAITFLIATLEFSAAARSKDLGLLTRVMFAADLAEQFTNLCVQADPAIAEKTMGPRGGMHSYGNHIKGEVTSGLSDTDVVTVLKAAADGSKTIATQSLYAFRSGPSEVAIGPLIQWCNDKAIPFVRQVIDTHDSQHEMILKLVDQAKKD